MIKWWMGAALVLSLQGDAAAQELPELIRSDLLNELKDCEQPVRSIKRSAIRIFDFNGDGIADYVIDYGEICSAYCGTGGCTHDIWVSQGTTWAKALSANIRDIESVGKVGGKTVLRVDLHGSFCDRVGADSCPHVIVWDGGALRMRRR